MKSRLAVRREVDLALVGQEGVALPLFLELGPELLRRHLRVLDLADLVLVPAARLSPISNSIIQL